MSRHPFQYDKQRAEENFRRRNLTGLNGLFLRAAQGDTKPLFDYLESGEELMLSRIEVQALLHLLRGLAPTRGTPRGPRGRRSEALTCAATMVWDEKQRRPRATGPGSRNAQRAVHEAAMGKALEWGKKAFPDCNLMAADIAAHIEKCKRKPTKAELTLLRECIEDSGSFPISRK
jgi:hypothetical protein